MREIFVQSASRLRKLLPLHSRWSRWTLLFVVTLVAARIALPFAIRAYVNDRLAHMDGYVGHVDDIDVSLYRGAYQLDGLVIRKIDGDDEIPFVEAPDVDIAIEWRALLDGAVVATIELAHPELNFVGGRGAQFGAGNDWQDLVDDLVPITINRFVIHEGTVHYREPSSRPRIDIALSHLEVVAQNLSTVRDPEVELAATIDAHGVVQSSGILDATVRLDPWAERPTFDLDLAVENLRASELNPLLEVYAGVDAERGRFFLYSEIESRDGSFEGYVKPMAEGLSVFQLGEDGDFFDQLGDAIVQLFEDVFENHGTDRFATRIPVSGSFDAVDLNGWEAVLGILSNSFIEAIEHGVEHGPGWRIERRTVARADRPE